MSAIKHTPTPWKILQRYPEATEHKGFNVRSKVNSEIVAQVWPMDEDGLEGEANAALIVRAVNRDHAFEPMREALVELLFRTKIERHEGLWIDRGPTGYLIDAEDAARAALAMADNP